MQRLSILLVLGPALLLGYGGPDVTFSFADLGGLNSTLNAINRSFGATDSFALVSPVVWVGGHGGGIVPPLSVGGRGAVYLQRAKSDSFDFETTGATAGFELGYPWTPVDYGWVRPCVELTASGWLDLLHSPSSFTNRTYRRWFVGWGLGVVPALEVMGRLRFAETHYLGLFVKGGYAVPFGGVRWYGHTPRPSLDWSGFVVQAGVRLGRLRERAYRL